MWGVKATTIVSPSVRRPRRRFTAELIQRFLRAFDRSDVCAAEFPRQHDLIYSVLLRWLQRWRQAPGGWPKAKRGPRRRLKLHELPLGSLLGAGRCAAEIVRNVATNTRA